MYQGEYAFSKVIYSIGIIYIPTCVFFELIAFDAFQSAKLLSLALEPTSKSPVNNKKNVMNLLDL